MNVGPSANLLQPPSTTRPAIVPLRRKPKRIRINGIPHNSYGRRYSPGRPLEIPDRQMIVDYFKAGLRVNQIATSLGVSHGCVSKIISRYRDTGSITPGTVALSRWKSAFETSFRKDRHETIARRNGETSATTSTTNALPSTMASPPSTMTLMAIEERPRESVTPVASSPTNDEISSLRAAVERISQPTETLQTHFMLETAVFENAFNNGITTTAYPTCSLSELSTASKSQNQITSLLTCTNMSEIPFLNAVTELAYPVPIYPALQSADITFPISDQVSPTAPLIESLVPYKHEPKVTTLVIYIVQQ